MKKQVNIIQAIRNERLFGALFTDTSSWRAWLVWLKAVFALKIGSEPSLTLIKGGRWEEG
jgi:hypothetical protein